jgi:poly(A) polymerase
LEPDPVRRLGALGVAVREDAERLTERLRLSNAEADRLLVLDGWRRVAPSAGEQAGHTLLYLLGPVSFADRVLIAWSRAGAETTEDDWRALVTLPQRWTAPIFPLKAADFLRRGVPKSPALGAALRAAEEAWVAADFPLAREALDAIAERSAQAAMVAP